MVMSKMTKEYTSIRVTKETRQDLEDLRQLLELRYDTITEDVIKCLIMAFKNSINSSKTNLNSRGEFIVDQPKTAKKTRKKRIKKVKNEV